VPHFIFFVVWHLKLCCHPCTLSGSCAHEGGGDSSPERTLNGDRILSGGACGRENRQRDIETGDVGCNYVADDEYMVRGVDGNIYKFRYEPKPYSSLGPNVEPRRCDLFLVVLGRGNVSS